MKLLGRVGDDFDTGALLVQMTVREWELLEALTRRSPPEVDEQVIAAYARFGRAARLAVAALDAEPNT